ncbi:hypothetical protein N7535_007600 [Penicillium sp. DV-2018c]|nr:hypothetical protein N7535_007600 [Penicillium sp. DV-2018c]
MGDIEEAIQVCHQAITATPDDHPDLPSCLTLLGIALRMRYERTGQVDNLEEAIRLSRHAVKATPDDHPKLTLTLINLGEALEFYCKRTGAVDDLKEAIRVSRQRFELTQAPPMLRIRSATQAIQLLLEQEDYDSAYALSIRAIDLLRLVHNRSLSLQDQGHVVSHCSGLATRACSLALQTGQPVSKAIELLERGRGVILGLLIDDWSDTSELRAAHPTLCALYKSLRVEVNTPAESTTSEWTGEAMSIRRPKALEELEECVQDIRQLPGFSAFERGLAIDQMTKAADEGSIIIVNVTSLRSDAIAVSSTGFRLVPLLHLDAVQAQNWVNQELTTTSSNDRGAKNKTYHSFLACLWQKCVKPVLNELGYQVQSSSENLPRVWWIGTGLASSFPFHAAGAHPCETTRLQLSCERPLKLLMVTMANTPGAQDLPGVKDETNAVLRELGTSVHVEILDQPDPASVMHQVHQCNIVHFACHGISDSVDPSASGLLLLTVSENPSQDILSVRKLCENHHAQGEIAYLSACSTAENRAEDLVDEVLHVASGFQVAGFRHVIGCLWPSDDNVCVEVARSFYAELCRNGTLNYTDRDVAMALHNAASKVSKSDEYRKRPLHWAQYVHYGA